MAIKTLVVQIGNSDNKLTQGKWSDYCFFVDADIEQFNDIIHFKGGSSFDSMYQNACWVFEIAENDIESLKNNLIEIKKRYDQDSIAIIEGDVYFI